VDELSHARCSSLAARRAAVSAASRYYPVLIRGNPSLRVSGVTVTLGRFLARGQFADLRFWLIEKSVSYVPAELWKNFQKSRVLWAKWDYEASCPNATDGHGLGGRRGRSRQEESAQLDCDYMRFHWTAKTDHNIARCVACVGSSTLGHRETMYTGCV
jgi:hypothetical protein